LAGNLQPAATIEVQRRAESARRQAAVAAQQQRQQQQAAVLEQQRQQAEFARRQQAARQAQAQRQAQARRQAAQSQPVQRQIGTLQLSDLGEGISTIETDTDWDVDTGQSTVHRHVPNAATTTTTERRQKTTINLRGRGSSLKRAFIFKELIDRPIALRDDQDLSF